MSTARFEGKGLVVVGGTYGVGPAVVVAAAEQGASVVFCGPPASKGVAVQIEATARSAGAAERVSFVPADVSSEADVDRLFDLALERLPSLFALVVNVENAAVPRDKPLIETSLADWNRVLAANLREPFFLSRRVIEEFLVGGEGGRIVYIMSGVADGTTGQVSHAASQTALRAFVRSVVKEYGQRGIVCNAVAIQSDLETEMTASVGFKEQREEDLLLPHYRLGRLRATAKVVLFLASDEASFVNGEVLCIGNAAHELNGDFHGPTLQAVHG